MRQRDRARLVDTEILEAIHELHDIRDKKTNLEAREKELSAEIIAHYEKALGPIPVGEEKGSGLNLGVCRITRRRGREAVKKEDIARMRDELGGLADEYISLYNGATVITHIDPELVEGIIYERARAEIPYAKI